MDKLTFRALGIRQSELGSKPGDCGLRGMWFIHRRLETLLVGTW